MSIDALKMAAARAALDQVEDGMALGIGSGSTAECFIRVLAERVADGLRIAGVPTSERSAALCRELGVPLVSLDDRPELDLAVDGADEFNRELSLIKGGGGALLREKIVAAAARRMIVVADDSKQVDMLGRFPLPVEVNKFGLKATTKAVAEAAADLGLGGTILLRHRGGAPFETDGGHLILDASFGRIPEPRALSAALHAIPGVVEHGLFLGLAEAVIVARADGVATLRPAGTEQEFRP